MPFIDSKITTKIDDNTKEQLKAELGKTMSLMGKGETYLMVGICDSYDLWMGGKKLDKGAYVEVSLLGDAGSDAYQKVTGAICEIFERVLGIPGSGVYVTYHPVKDWGWNGSNF